MSTTTERMVRRFLERPTWLQTIDTRTNYARVHDDNDGDRRERLVLIFGPDGDAHLWVEGEQPSPALRFRNGSGGGRSLRTHAALMILAEAMRLDELQDPHSPSNAKMRDA